MFITTTRINTNLDVFTCDMADDMEVLKGVRYGKVVINLSKFPLVNAAFNPAANKDHGDYLLGQLDGETSSLLWREAAAKNNWTTNEELNAFFDEIDVVKDIVKVAQEGHNQIFFKKD